MLGFQRNSTWLCTFAFVSGAFGFAHIAVAQSYPNKAIRFIVPFPPGGGTDILSRHVTNKMTEKGWTVVVDNRPGAGGNLGVEAAAKAPPDGYTLVMGQTSNLAINPSLYSKLPYDPLRDLKPVTLVSSIPIALMVVAKSSYTTLADLVAAAKAKPDQVIAASTGNGTVGHLSSLLFQNAAGVRLIHVPYKGAAQAFPDLLGGRLHTFWSSLETAMPQVRGGTIRLLAVTSAKRSPSAPEVPTVAESGYKGFEAATWFGVLAPARTPDAIVTQLSAEITRILQLPEVKDRMVDGGGDIQTGPKAFAALIKADTAKWSKIVQESGAKAD